MNTAEVRTYAVELANRLVAGESLKADDFGPIVTLPAQQAGELFDGIEVLRQRTMPQGVHVCTICNAKSGHCTEDCRFCAQARTSRANIEVYPLRDRAALCEFLEQNARPPIDRCALVTSGRRVSTRELAVIADALASFPERTHHLCASLGLLDDDELRLLKASGLTRYHCNLETARSHFGNIATSHGYDDKLRTIQSAKRQGLSLCVGGLFGIGETDEQILEFALELREIQPQAVPVNFLAPIPGTPLCDTARMDPWRCLKIIALLRFVLPRQDILLCGGRALNLGEHQRLAFDAGATGLMTGNYLTTSGCSLSEDLELLARLSLVPRTAV